MIASELKILLIDTNMETLSSIETALKSEGFGVFSSTHSKDAIQMAKEELPPLKIRL